MVMVELDIGPRPSTLPPKEEILGVMVKYVEVFLKISSTMLAQYYFTLPLLHNILNIYFYLDILSFHISAYFGRRDNN